jgi:hypothetical protein
MRKLLTFAPVLLILLSTAVMAQGGPVPCRPRMPVQSCWGQWNAVPSQLSIPLPYIPSLIVVNLTTFVGTNDDNRPYEQIVIRSVLRTTFTDVEGTKPCKFTLRLEGPKLSLVKNACTQTPAFEYTLIP